MNKPNIIATETNITILFRDESPVVISKHDPKYKEAIKFISLNDNEALKDLCLTKEKVMDVSLGGGDVKVVLNFETGKVSINGESDFNKYIESKIIQFAKDGIDYQPLANFLAKVSQNPSSTAIDELYVFLEQSGLPLDPDGDFYAYKMVRDNFTDCFSGTVDHSIGASPEMPRGKVCDDRRKTCDKGLHFCSKGYLPMAYRLSGSSRCVLLKINPKDVVSIPYDYNNSKGRACKLFVFEEITNREEIEKLYESAGVINYGGENEDEEFENWMDNISDEDEEWDLCDENDSDEDDVDENENEDEDDIDDTDEETKELQNSIIIGDNQVENKLSALLPPELE